MKHFLFPKCLIGTDCSKVLSCEIIYFYVLKKKKKNSILIFEKGCNEIPPLGHRCICISSLKYYRFQIHFFYYHDRQLCWEKGMELSLHKWKGLSSYDLKGEKFWSYTLLFSKPVAIRLRTTAQGFVAPCCFRKAYFTIRNCPYGFTKAMLAGG